jgi:dinuclear metal center YbgI/SA1388 family protein
MNTVKEIFDKLCEFAPLELQTSYDNAGFLVGHASAPVHTALLSLDVTNEVIEEAISLGAGLIISHHPVIWDEMKSLTDDTVEKARVLRLIENGIAVISMHTNLAIAEGGVNDVLIRLLGAEPEGSLDADSCGRIGYLPQPMPLEDFLADCKERLGVPTVRYCLGKKPVYKIPHLRG